MANFDVESLFTNMPLGELLDIILNSLFADTSNVKDWINEILIKLLYITTNAIIYLFNGKF